jgi:hypothetical protein
MALPRSKYVQEGQEGVYHCFSRCVRRAFLCGFDTVTHRDFSHRKTLLFNRLRHLALIFAVEVCAYAILETHYHLILRIRPDIVALWSDREVATRWLTLFPQHRKSKRDPVSPSEEEISALMNRPERIAQLRQRLSSLSWFMGRLNEFIARAANKEDGVSGRFWESRFKCQALLDEAAIAACMVYVDLSPIRAGLAGTLEESDFTSIQERIRAWQKETMMTEGGGAVNATQSSTCGTATSTPDHPAETPDPVTGRSVAVVNSLDALSYPARWLCPIQSGKGRRGILQMSEVEYFDLVDRSGRLTRSGKRGAIDTDLAPVLTRIGANPEAWLDTVTCFGSRFRLAAGLLANMRRFAARLGRHWFKGAAAARAAFTLSPAQLT